MGLWIVLALLPGLGDISRAAQQLVPTRPNEMLEVQRHRLPNGLEVWIKPRRDTQAVEVRVVVKVGFRQEAPRDSGLSHLLEHMLFKGTERQSEAELKWAVERRGGSRNGVTALEATHYYVNIRDVHFPFAVEWLEDIVFQSRLSEEHLQQARKDVYSEQGGRYPRVIEQIFLTGLFQPPELRAGELAFPHAEIAERVIANLEHVDASRARRHFNQFYRPGNMAVIVVGNVDPSTALAEVAKWFGSRQAGVGSLGQSIPYREPKRSPEVRTRFYPPVGQMTDVRYGLWTRGRRDPDRLALRLLCRHLDRRLKEEIRYKRALAYSVGCAAFDTVDAGALFGYSEGGRAAEGEVKELLQAVTGEVLARELTAEEVTDAREALVGSQVRYYENNSRLADFYQDLFLSVPFGRPLPDEMTALASVTGAELQRVARARLQPDSLMFVVARPPLTYTGTVMLGILVLLLIAALIALRVRRRRRA